MRIYEGDFTVRNIMEDCSAQPGETGAEQVQHRRVVDGIDLDKLAERLRHIPVEEIRQRKQRMEVFYQEMMLSADPERGISFSSCLMILAHYNVIEDSRSLRLEEFLRRRARLQRVHESIRRNVVIGFFDTMYWSRRFRQAVESRRNSRLGGPPQMLVPEIFIEDEDESSSSVEPHDFTESTPLKHPTTRSSPSPTLPRIDTFVSTRSPPGASPRTSFDLSPTASPRLSTRPRLQSIDTSYPGPGSGRSPPGTPTLGHSRHNSNVSGISAQGVMESFDSSAWGESIRRGLTQRGSR
jgi:voltage-dependent calcium channel